MDIQYFGVPTRCQVVRISPRPLPHRNASKCIKTHDSAAVDFPRSAARGRANRPASGCTKTRQLSGAGRRGGDCEFRRFAAASPHPSPSPWWRLRPAYSPLAGLAAEPPARAQSATGEPPRRRVRCRLALARPPSARPAITPARLRHRDQVRARRPPDHPAAAGPSAPGRPARRRPGARLALAARRATAPARVRHRDQVHARRPPGHPAAAGPSAPGRPARRRPGARRTRQPQRDYGAATRCATGRHLVTRPRPAPAHRVDQLAAGQALAARQLRAAQHPPARREKGHAKADRSETNWRHTNKKAAPGFPVRGLAMAAEMTESYLAAGAGGISYLSNVTTSSPSQLFSSANCT